MRRQIWRWQRAAINKPLAAEQPLRSQLLSAEQMEVHGRRLARSQQVHMRPQPDLLLARLKENEGLLDDASTLLTRMVRDDVRITPAASGLKHFVAGVAAAGTRGDDDATHPTQESNGTPVTCRPHRMQLGSSRRSP